MSPAAAETQSLKGLAEAFTQTAQAVLELARNSSDMSTSSNPPSVPDGQCTIR